MTPFSARLYYFYAPGCAYCARAEPDVHRFMVAHPGVLVVRVNSQRRESIHGFAPEGTPAYLLLLDDHVAFQHVGAVTATKLDAVYRKALANYQAGVEGLADAEEDEDDEEKADEVGKDEEE